MDLIAKLPTLAAAIYRNLYRDGKVSLLEEFYLGCVGHRQARM